MEKLLSFAIPCYNSQDYMAKCIESLLPGGDEVEIIVVNDGSTDDTEKIANEYVEKYPNIVRLVNKENGGHGDAVNTGLANATGRYFKVVDSDDWVDEAAYQQVLAILHKFVEDDTCVDVLITNYVYEKVDADHHRRMMYTALFPEDMVMTWADMKHNIKGFSILMHSVTYRRDFIQSCNVVLPKHTFYVDNLFVYEPLSKAESLYYLNVDFYRYYIGRDGQSVAEETMIKRFDQQLKVNYTMVDSVDPWAIEEEHHRKYILSYLETITVVTTSIAYMSHDKEKYQQASDLWKYIKQKDWRTYYKLRYGILGNSVTHKGKVGRAFARECYKISNKFLGFN